MKKKIIAIVLMLGIFAGGASATGTTLAKEAKTGEGDILTGDYVAIVNTDPDTTKKQSTGTITFNPNGDTANSIKEEEAAPMILEDGTTFAEEEMDVGKQKNVKKSFWNLRATTTYEIGNEKKFYMNKNYICIGVGQECYIWMEEGMYKGYEAAGKAEKAAAEMKFVYEGEPFQMLKTMSNDKMYFADNSGKLSILLEDTGDSSGFYAGESDITAIHIKSPEANRYTGGQFAGKNGLLVHEGQHALFRDSTCNHNGSIANKYSWLNEGLAVTAMDYTWGGADPNGWMAYINDSTEIRNGAPLVYSSYRGRTALDYGMQYAFIRYLSNRLAGGVYNPMPFFHAVYATDGEGKNAKTFVEAVIQEYHKVNPSSPNPTFEEVLTGYYAAMVAFNPNGPYGFGNDRIPSGKITNYPIYMGESGKSIDLAGTGAIIVKTVNGQFEKPANAGANIQFVAFDKAEKIKPEEGDGTQANPYLIKKAEDVSFLSDYSSAVFRVENDIDMSTNTEVYVPVNKFLGTLDGNGHQISNLTTALIATNEGTIKDLSVDVELTDEYLGDVGFLVDQNKGYIQGCTAKGTIKARLIGGNMVLPNNFGAIAGATIIASTVRECYGEVNAVLDLSTNHARIGALIGENQGNVYDSYAKGSVEVNQNATDRSLYVGGAIGSLFCRMSPAPYIRNIYSMTEVTVNGNADDQVVGSLIGNVQGTTTPTIEYSYGLKDMETAGNKVLGNGTTAGNNACGKTQKELEQQSTYEKWDFGSVWKMPQSGTPRFTETADIGDIKTFIAYKEYFVGEKLNLYGSTLNIGDSSIPILSEMLTGFDSSTVGTKTVKGIYKGKKFSFEVEVKKPTTVENLFIHKGAKDHYVEGDTFDPQGVVLRATLDGSSNRYIYSGYTANKGKGLTKTDTSVTYTYGNSTVTQSIKVDGKRISSLKLIQVPKEHVYQEGSIVTLDGAVFQIQYNDGTFSDIFNMSQAANYKIKWGIRDGTMESDFDIAQKLKFADHGKEIYAYCQENKSAKTKVMTLNIKAAMKLDDEVFVAAVGTTEYPFSKSITGGSGNYSSRLKDGYSLTGTGVGIYSKPGDLGADNFRFEISSDKEGTVILPFIITDNETGATMEVNMTFIFQKLSTACSVLKVDVSTGWSQKDPTFAGIIDEENQKIKITIPDGISKTSLLYSNPILSRGAASKPQNGEAVCGQDSNPKPLVITAQDGKTKQTYTVELMQAPATAKELEKAKNLVWDGNIATWGKVENASGYVVYLQAIESGSLSPEAIAYSTKDLQYDFTKDLKMSGKYVFRVVALGDGTNFVDGPAAQSSVYDYKRSPEVTNILVEPQTADVYRGQTRKFNAIVSGVSSPDKSVVWSVQGAVSSNTKIAQDGLLTIGEDESANELNVVAESVQTPSVRGKAQVKVGSMPAIAAPTELTWSWEIAEDTGLATKAEAKWKEVSDAAGYRVTLLKDGIPIGNELGNDITVGSEIKQYDFKDRLMGAGNYSFRVAAIGNGTTHSDSMAATSGVQTYEVKYAVTGVSISPEAVTLKAGSTQTFTAIVQGHVSVPQDVRWEISGAEKAETSIGKTGTLTVADDESAKTIIVKVIAVQDSSKQAEAVVTVDERTQLAKPEVLNWDWEEQEGTVKKAQATWKKVEHASGYQITLLRDDVPVQDFIGIEVDSQTFSHEFAEAIIRSGTYKFEVTALGNRDTYRDSETIRVTQGKNYLISTVTGVKVTPDAATVKQGQKAVFSAVVIGDETSSQEVTWSIVETVTEGTAIADTGELSVAAKESNPTITVKATSVQDSSKFGTAQVTITQMEKLPVPKDLSWTWEVDGKGSVTKAIANWNKSEDASGYRVTLLENGKPIAEAVEVGKSAASHDFTANITKSGNYAFSIVAVGDGQSYQDSPAGTSTVHNYVLPAQVTEVKITSNVTEIEKGKTGQFTASVIGTDNPPQEVKWSISSGNLSGATQIDSSGKLTVAKEETAKQIEVTATSTYDKEKSATVTVAIKTPDPIVTNVTVSPSSATVQQGKTQEFTAQVVGDFAPSQEVTWSIAETVTEGTTISDDGILSVAAKESNSTIMVKATSVQDSSKFGTTAVTITPLPKLPKPGNLSWTWEVDGKGIVTKAAANWSKSTDASGYRITLLENGKPIADAVEVEEDITSHDFVNGVTKSGKYAFNIVAIGDGETNQDSTADTSTEHDYVVPVQVTEVKITSNVTEIEKGKTGQFTASVNGTDNPSQEVKWSISGGSFSGETQIDSGGKLAIAKEETAKKINVTATSEYDAEKSATVIVTIKTPNPIVTNVTVSPSEATVRQGQTQGFSAQVLGDFDPSQAVTWSIAETVTEGTTISDSGVLTVAWNENNTTITVEATSQENSNQSGTAAVTITELPQLQTPTALTWNKEVASWNDVTNAVDYKVELYKDGSKQGETVAATSHSYDFSDEISVTGEYTFKIIAVGNHTDYADSNQEESGVYRYIAPPKVTKVVVMPQAPIEIRTGKSQKFNALVTGTDNPPSTVQWKVSGHQSEHTLMEDTGQFTVGEDETAENVTVTAISTYDARQSGSVVVTIIPKPNTVESLKEFIHALPEPNNVKDKDAAVIGEAKAAYDKLSKEEKEQLTDSERGKLSQVIGALNHIELLVTWEGLAEGNRVTVEYLGLTVTPEEIIGTEKVIVTMDVKQVEKTLDEEILSALASQYKLEVGSLYTVVLHKKTAGSKVQSITETESLRIMLTIPEEIRGKALYAVLRVHDKQGEVVASQVSSNEIVFHSGLFSTYAIAYGKEEKAPENPHEISPENPTADSLTKPSAKQLENKGKVSKNPVSGDDTRSMTYLLLLVASGIIIGGVLLIRRKRKKDESRNS